MIANINPVANALARQLNTIAACNVQAHTAKHRAQLLLRMLYKVPLHEWAQAQARGATAVRLLIEAYEPTNAPQLLDDGEVPRCPPWASRRYREAATRCCGSDASPRVLCGTAAIGARLGLTPRLVAELHRQRYLPTYKGSMDKLLRAEVEALDEWAAQPIAADFRS